MIFLLAAIAPALAPMETTTIPPQAAQQQSPGASIPSYMTISPASRALDFQQAFDKLSKEKSNGKIFFQLADGSMIGNVIEMIVMPNSTLIIFRFNSSQGVQFQVVKVEDIVGLRY